MAIQEQQLFQVRPGGVAAVSGYSPAASTTVIIKDIYICNQTANPETFQLFHDDDGTTYDQTTALYYTVAIAANTTTHLSVFIAMNNSAGNFAVQTSTASALTFTGYGAVIT